MNTQRITHLILVILTAIIFTNQFANAEDLGYEDIDISTERITAGDGEQLFVEFVVTPEFDGGRMYVSIGLPDMRYDNDISARESRLDMLKIYEYGDTVWRLDYYEIESEHVLVEGETDNVDAGRGYTLKVYLDPSLDEEDFEVYLRACYDDNNGNRHYWPRKSGTIDQQGWSVEVKNIRVDEPDIDTDCDIWFDSATVAPGEEVIITVDAEITVNDEFEQIDKIRLYINGDRIHTENNVDTSPAIPGYTYRVPLTSSGTQTVKAVCYYEDHQWEDEETFEVQNWWEEEPEVVESDDEPALNEEVDYNGQLWLDREVIFPGEVVLIEAEANISLNGELVQPDLAEVYINGNLKYQEAFPVTRPEISYTYTSPDDTLGTQEVTVLFYYGERIWSEQNSFEVIAYEAELQLSVPTIPGATYLEAAYGEDLDINLSIDDNYGLTQAKIFLDGILYDATTEITGEDPEVTFGILWEDLRPYIGRQVLVTFLVTDEFTSEELTKSIFVHGPGDNEGPLITFISPEEYEFIPLESSLFLDVDLRFTITDGNSIQSFRIEFDEEVYDVVQNGPPYSSDRIDHSEHGFPLIMRDVHNGYHTVRIIALDEFGNESEITRVFNTMGTLMELAVEYSVEDHPTQVPYEQTPDYISCRNREGFVVIDLDGTVWHLGESYNNIAELEEIVLDDYCSHWGCPTFELEAYEINFDGSVIFQIVGLEEEDLTWFQTKIEQAQGLAGICTFRSTSACYEMEFGSTVTLFAPVLAPLEAGQDVVSATGGLFGFIVNGTLFFFSQNEENRRLAADYGVTFLFSTASVIIPSADPQGIRAGWRFLKQGDMVVDPSLFRNVRKSESFLDIKRIMGSEEIFESRFINTLKRVGVEEIDPRNYNALMNTVRRIPLGYGRNALLNPRNTKVFNALTSELQEEAIKMLTNLSEVSTKSRTGSIVAKRFLNNVRLDWSKEFLEKAASSTNKGDKFEAYVKAIMQGNGLRRARVRNFDGSVADLADPSNFRNTAGNIVGSSSSRNNIYIHRTTGEPYIGPRPPSRHFEQTGDIDSAFVDKTGHLYVIESKASGGSVNKGIRQLQRHREAGIFNFIQRNSDEVVTEAGLTEVVWAGSLTETISEVSQNDNIFVIPVRLGKIFLDAIEEDFAEEEDDDTPDESIPTTSSSGSLTELQEILRLLSVTTCTGSSHNLTLKVKRWGRGVEVEGTLSANTILARREALDAFLFVVVEETGEIFVFSKDGNPFLVDMEQLDLINRFELLHTPVVGEFSFPLLQIDDLTGVNGSYQFGVILTPEGASLADEDNWKFICISHKLTVNNGYISVVH